ncbi:MAG: glycosyltransferase family 25 protein [Rhizobiaceae bacterium]|nr:glycosyltransferase family 25 protein [Rhizobiaceae bacterium]
MLPIFVINLKSAISRWDSCTASANENGIKLTRIDALRASEPRDSWINVSQFWFSIFHGRRILPGEYGCYQSHLMALDKIISSDLSLALICEDDVLFSSELIQNIEEIFELQPDLDVLKLVNHRCHGFRGVARTSTNREVGYTLFGPLGSAAAYAVSAEGAKQVRKSLEVMTLPYDNALERGWANGYNIQCVKNNWLSFSSETQDSQIATNYKASKYAFYLRISALFFRVKEVFSRLFYALKFMAKYR